MTGEPTTPMGTSRVRIGINLLPIMPGHGGIRTHVRGLLTGFRELGVAEDIILFINRELANEPAEWTRGFETVRTGVRARSRPRRYIYEQAAMPVQVRRTDIDVLHCPGYSVPLYADVPTVVTIHDVNYEAVPETFSTLSRFVWGQIVPRSARRASAVITVSSFSREEIRRHVGIDHSRIHVVSNAPSPQLPRSPPPLDSIDIDVEPPYILYVSSTHPHKNHATLVRSLPRLPDELSMVLVGPKRAAHPDLVSLIDSLGLHDRVAMPGFVPEPTLATLYGNAHLYVHPSMYEGFGMPVIEAMRYGTPVVCADVAALPEIAGDAALYFDPTSPDEIAAACEELITSPQLRDEMIEEGFTRQARYSWTKSAEQTVDVCRSVLP